LKIITSTNEVSSPNAITRGITDDGSTQSWSGSKRAHKKLQIWGISANQRNKAAMMQLEHQKYEGTQPMVALRQSCCIAVPVHLVTTQYMVKWIVT
jgi:hypothetical protein